MAEAAERATTDPVDDDPKERLQTARGRLADRGIAPDQIIGQGQDGTAISVAGFYGILSIVGATEKAGQSPTYALARLALRSDLPGEIADTLFLAYNQQSAEEAGHGDKVFGNAYFAMGRVAPGGESSVFGDGGDVARGLEPGDDPSDNQRRLGSTAAAIGGIETVALQQLFPLVTTLCERWDHPIGRALVTQIRDVV